MRRLAATYCLSRGAVGARTEPDLPALPPCGAWDTDRYQIPRRESLGWPLDGPKAPSIPDCSSICAGYQAGGAGLSFPSGRPERAPVTSRVCPPIPSTKYTAKHANAIASRASGLTPASRTEAIGHPECS